MSSPVSLAQDRLRPAREAFRTLLVPVQPEPSAKPLLASAAALARILDATLFGIAVESVEALGVGDLVRTADETTWRDIRAELARDLDLAEKAFREVTQGLRTDWLAIEGAPVETTCRVSRGADLIVAGGAVRKGQSPARWCDPAELILLSGRPVLIVPPRGGSLTVDAVVVAWKDTREARRALADAMPLLRAAREVLVLELCEDSDFGAAQGRTYEVVQGLRRHDVNARASAVIGNPDAVARELNTRAAAIGADLIVVGGYGRSRLNEWVFGGVTRDLLRKPEHFLFFSH